MRPLMAGASAAGLAKASEPEVQVVKVELQAVPNTTTQDEGNLCRWGWSHSLVVAAAADAAVATAADFHQRCSRGCCRQEHRVATWGGVSP